MTQTKLNTPESPEWVLMAKALRGELSDLEQQEFTAWLNEDDSHTHMWTEALEVWDEVGNEHNQTFQPNEELAWFKFCAQSEFTPETKIIPLIPQEPVVEHQEKEQGVEEFFPWNTLYKYAAAFILAVGLAWLGYLQFNTSSALTQIATAAGERRLVYLPDSSRVTLNENSSIRYQSAFKGTERQVELVGEGFFEVRRNPDKLFVVKSGNAQTKVLGTSFNVKAIKGEPEVSVAVYTGKVSFSSLNTNNQVLLTPGHSAVLTGNGQLNKTKTVATTTSWKSLAFQNTSIPEVASQLEKYFNVPVTISNSNLKACTFTGTFENPDLQEIVTVLAASSNLRVNKSENGKYTLEGSGCQ